MIRRFLNSGTIFIWLSGGIAALSLLMIGGLLALILMNGLSIFWPRPVAEFTLTDQSKLLGEAWNREAIPQTELGPARYRQRIKIGNRDLFGLDFRWVNEDEIEAIRHPDSVVVLERRAWGNFIGYLTEFTSADSLVARDAWKTWEALSSRLDQSNELYQKILKIEKQRIGDINYDLERNRLNIRRLALAGDTTRAQVQKKLQNFREHNERLQAEYHLLEKQLTALRTLSDRDHLILQAADGSTREIPLIDIVRAYHPNAIGKMHKAMLYAERLGEFLFDEPREANMEGGIFPAIFGTVLMVLIMSIAVVPLGVLAAIYMREYARQGPLLRAVRIAVNNLAGVPSIVFGVFGLGFFIYAIGGTVDQMFYAEALPTPTFGTGGILWASLTLALLTVPVVIVAAEEGLAAVPLNIREGSLALGATKFETLARLVLPAASPGILTGLILAMARAAGEVAPLMITGVVKLAPTLPLDHRFPFLHLERKFMHLGFHIYDVGFQSPNVEAAVPMVYATTLLLILVVVSLNFSAIVLRSRLRKRFSLGQL